jgi:hypothetical protein
VTEPNKPFHSSTPNGDTPLDVFLLGMLYGELFEPDERLPSDGDEFVAGWLIQQEDEPSDFASAWTAIGQSFGALHTPELIDQGALAEAPPSDIRWTGRDGAALTHEQFTELLSQTKQLYAELLALCTESDIATDAANELVSDEDQNELAVFPLPTKQEQLADYTSAVSLYRAFGFSVSAPDCIFAQCPDGIIRLYGRVPPFLDSPYCRVAAVLGCDLRLTPLQRMALSNSGSPRLRIPNDWCPTVASLTKAHGKQDDRAVGRWLYDTLSRYDNNAVWTAASDLRALLKKVRTISDYTASYVGVAADRVCQTASSSVVDVEIFFDTLRSDLLEEDTNTRPSPDDPEVQRYYEYSEDIANTSQAASEWCTAILPTLESASMLASAKLVIKLRDDLDSNYRLAPTWTTFCRRYVELRHRQVRAVRDAEAICQVAWSEVFLQQNAPKTQHDAFSLPQLMAYFTPKMIEPHRVLLEQMVKHFEDKAHPVLIATQGVALVQAFVQMMAAPHLEECRSTETADILSALRSKLKRTKASKGRWTAEEEDLSYCVNVASMAHHTSNIARHQPEHPLTRSDASLMLNGLLVLLNRIEKQRG